MSSTLVNLSNRVKLGTFSATVAPGPSGYGQLQLSPPSSVIRFVLDTATLLGTACDIVINGLNQV